VCEVGLQEARNAVAVAETQSYLAPHAAAPVRHRRADADQPRRRIEGHGVAGVVETLHGSHEKVRDLSPIGDTALCRRP
jgi:hypothetical protein